MFLKIDPNKYTGHSFRRSATTAAADSGISLINLKRIRGWKSDSVASSYLDDSLAIKKSTADLLLPSPSSDTPVESWKSLDSIVALQLEQLVDIKKGIPTAEEASSLLQASTKSANVISIFM